MYNEKNIVPHPPTFLVEILLCNIKTQKVYSLTEVFTTDKIFFHYLIYKEISRISRGNNQLGKIKYENFKIKSIWSNHISYIQTHSECKFMQIKIYSMLAMKNPNMVGL